MQYDDVITNPRWRTAAILKNGFLLIFLPAPNRQGPIRGGQKNNKTETMQCCTAECVLAKA